MEDNKKINKDSNGIVNQLAENRVSLKGEFSLKFLEEYFKDLFYSKQNGTNDKSVVRDIQVLQPSANDFFGEGKSIEDIILDGYFYRLGVSDIEQINKIDRNIVATTGKGGVIQYIRSCKEQGFTDEILIAGTIEVYVSSQWIRLTNKRLHHKEL